MSVFEKKSELDALLKKLGISRNEFAKKFIAATAENDDECDDVATAKFKDKFKKQMRRSTTKVETIQRYLDFLCQTPAFQKAELVKTQSCSTDAFGPEGRDAMYRISRNLTKMLKEDEKKLNSEF